MIINLPSAGTREALVRLSAARLIAPGSCTRISVMASYFCRRVIPTDPFTGAAMAPFASDILDLLQQQLHLVGGRHGGRAFAAGSDDRTGRVGEPQNGLQVPALEQAVAERAAEAVPGAKPVD